jgi:hypothetical protein
VYIYVYIYLWLIPNGFRDKAISLYSSTTANCTYTPHPMSSRGFQSALMVFVIPFYLQSVPVHSANCVL